MSNNMTLKEIAPLIDKMNVSTLYALSIYIKRKITEARKVKHNQIVIGDSNISDIIEHVNSQIGIDLSKKSRVKIFTFSRFAFVGVIHEIISIQNPTQKGWSMIANALKKDHASVIHMHRVHLVELALNNIEYNIIYENIRDIITEYISLKKAE